MHNWHKSSRNRKCSWQPVQSTFEGETTLANNGKEPPLRFVISRLYIYNCRAAQNNWKLKKGRKRQPQFESAMRRMRKRIVTLCVMNWERNKDIQNFNLLFNFSCHQNVCIYIIYVTFLFRLLILFLINYIWSYVHLQYKMIIITVKLVGYNLRLNSWCDDSLSSPFISL